MPEGPSTVAEQSPEARRADWMILALLCVGQFMVVLDLSIVNVALPAMQRNLGFSTSQLQWVVNAYALSFGGFILLGGRAADLFGRRRVFMAGLILFAGASLVCAVAQDKQMLIGARALQGLGAAVLSPATLTILTTTFREPRARARAIGIWSAMAAAGGASGALLGGVLTDLLSWRWIFYINVPIGVAALVAARVVLVETRANTDRSTLDVLGAVTVTGGLVALVYAIAGTDTHPWLSPDTVVPLVLSATLLAAFVLIETRSSRVPLVPFGLFRSRGVTAGNTVMFLVGGAMFSMWLFLSLYLQDVLRFSPLRAGVGFLPQTIAIAAGAQISSRILPRTGPRPPMLAGVLVATVGLAWLSHVSATGSYVTDVLGGSVLATFGMGLAMTPMAFSATAGVPREEAGLASGLLNTSRQVGGSIALAVLATTAAARTSALLAGSPHSRSEVAAALTAGFSRVFLIAAGIAFCGLVAALFVPAPSRQAFVARGVVAGSQDHPNAEVDPAMQSGVHGERRAMAVTPEP